MEITKEQYKKIEEQAEEYLEYWREQMALSGDVSYTLPDVSTVIAIFKYQQYGE
jgi:hypothetical protein